MSLHGAINSLKDAYQTLDNALPCEAYETTDSAFIRTEKVNQMVLDILRNVQRAQIDLASAVIEIEKHMKEEADAD